MDVINFLVGNLDACDDNTQFVFIILRWIIRIIQIGAPFALIIWGSLDFFKAVIAGDEKEMKAKRKPFIQRLIAAVIILLLPMLVDIIVSTLNPDTAGKFKNCWENAKPGQKLNLPTDSGNLPI